MEKFATYPFNYNYNFFADTCFKRQPNSFYDEGFIKSNYEKIKFTKKVFGTKKTLIIEKGIMSNATIVLLFLEELRKIF